MEKDNQQSTANTKLTPPSQSRASMLLNGIGNGAMLGFMPLGIVEFASLFFKEQYRLPKRVTLPLAFLGVGGCAVGAWFGVREGKQVDKYREAINARLNANTQAIQELAAKLNVPGASVDIQR